MLLKIAAIGTLVLAGFWLAPAAAAAPSATATQPPLDFGRDRRCHDACDVLLRRLADLELRRGRDAQSRSATSARACCSASRASSLLYTVGRLRLRRMRSGPQELAASKTPASDVMRLALGESGATFIALGIAISALGFLSQGMLTAPRVYFAMAEDGFFFRSVAKVSERARVPVVAIVLQGVAASIIALSGTFGQISELRRFGRLHLLRADRCCPVRLPPAGPRAGGRLQGPAAPVDDRSVCHCLRGHGHRHGVE